MNLLTVENITKSFTERLLFDKASFYLNEGEKVGVVGINGTGKTTLLRIIAGMEEPDEGNVTCARNTVVRFLPQHPTIKEGQSILQNVLEGSGIKDDHWELEEEAKILLTKLGITDFQKPAGQLSGGQKKRLALASVLLLPADVLILDEPTNHLDNAMAEWLEDYLKKWRGALIMVTHDRYFLDCVSNRIVEIDKGQIFSYQTNYSGFVMLKAEREEMAFASERKRQTILRKELEWLGRGARARSTKQKAHIQRIEEMKEQSGPAIDGKVELSSIASRLGRTTVELEHITHGYDGMSLIKDFSYIFLKDDRVGFIGANGCGKSTLMKMIIGKIVPNQGEIVRGQTVKIGYYSQEIETHEEAGIAYMNPAIRVIDYIRETAEYVQTQEGSISASQMLEKFLFDAKEQYNLIGYLSGGEKRRLNLLRVLMEAPNVLILDEPTNDLDITTLTILEDYLDTFQGIVIIVSHDRYFLDRTVRRIFAFEDNGSIGQYEGNYTDYYEKMQEREEIVQETEQKVSEGSDKNPNSRSRERKLKFSFKEQREYENIEEEIAEIETAIETLESEIIKAATDHVRLRELVQVKEEQEQKLEEKMQRWFYLEELNQRIEEGKE